MDDRSDHARSAAQQARRHRQRDAAHAGAQRVLRHREGRPGRVRQPVHAARRDAGAGAGHPDASRRADAHGRPDVARRVRSTTMGEGDIWILNDTYLGGTHLPDIAIMMPVFADGRVIAISAAMTHHQDVGGMSPGSTPTNATEIFQEGMRIPLLQFRRGDVLNDTLIAMLRQNVRLPGRADGRHQRAGCGLHDRRAAAGRTGRQLRPRRTAGAVRRTARTAPRR